MLLIANNLFIYICMYMYIVIGAGRWKQIKENRIALHGDKPLIQILKNMKTQPVANQKGKKHYFTLLFALFYTTQFFCVAFSITCLFVFILFYFKKKQNLISHQSYFILSYYISHFPHFLTPFPFLIFSYLFLSFLIFSYLLN